VRNDALGRNKKMRRMAMLLFAAVAFTNFDVSAAVADEPPARTAKKKVVLKAKPITKAPPPSQHQFGVLVGVNGGYDWGRATLSGFPFLENSVNARSGMAGITFGYNAQSGSVVYGFETDLDAAWMKSTNWGLPPCFACEVQLRYFGTVRGRVGYAVGKALPYFTAGLAYGGLKTSNLLLGTSEKDAKFGWTVGGGGEYAIAGAWSMKFEYLYFELEKMDCGVLTCGANAEVEFKGNLLRTGFNYRF
jgi:outer membrane immunogenic protein